ncbi:MAG: class I SAM-dependent methyltransferase [Phycisphaerales bacterium]|nr:class I SAM-dependent methyltransferase [Phycisphaerales bacterium]
MTTVPSTPGSLQRRSIRRRAAALQLPRRRGALEWLGRRLIDAAIGSIRHGSVRLVDGHGNVPSPATIDRNGEPGDLPPVTVRVLDPAFYAAAAFGGSVGIAEAFIEGLWESDDLPALIELLTLNLSAARSLESPLARLLGPLSRAAYRLERNTRAGSRLNIISHYDLGNQFFSLFLDPTMTYSCAVFENGAHTLEQAQVEKIDRACRKLALSPEDHLLEIGTGWGALAIHAARRYGCRVTTTTISPEQHRLATASVLRAGLQDRVTVLCQDYRDLRGTFNKLVSIEMVEAVGREHFDTYFAACSRLLQPDGAALIQSIVIRDQYFEQAARRRDFLKKYIFPGSCLPSVGAMLDSLRRRTDLRLWHLEDLGPHYATTLRHWRDAFAERVDDVRGMGFDDRFIRMWTYYLAYCEGAFRARHVGDVQMLLTKPECRLPSAGPAAAGLP